MDNKCPFEVGEAVICINNDGAKLLNLGQIYIVQPSFDRFRLNEKDNVLIEFRKGKVSGFFPSRFKRASKEGILYYG